MNRFFVFFLYYMLTGCHVFQTDFEARDAMANTHAQLALAYLKAQNPEIGKEKLLLAQQEAPEDAMIWNVSGYFWTQVGNNAAARQAYLKAVSLEPNSGITQNNYGVFLCKQGEYEAAAEHFLMALKDQTYVYPDKIRKNLLRCKSYFAYPF